MTLDGRSQLPRDYVTDTHLTMVLTSYFSLILHCALIPWMTESFSCHRLASFCLLAGRELTALIVPTPRREEGKSPP